jgi:predicted SAM-dependent methyltransferase
MGSPKPYRKGIVYSILKSGVAGLPRPLKDAVMRRILHAQPDRIKQAIKCLEDEIRIDELSHAAVVQFQKLEGKKDLKIHLGCGDDIKPGWVNLDLRMSGSFPQIHNLLPDTLLINYDLRLGLPLEDNSCNLIYSSHFFEHLEYEDALRLLRDCCRVLQPGGVFRACLPNFKGLFEAYLRGDNAYLDLIDVLDVYPEIEPGTEMLVDHVNYGVYDHGTHRWVMDSDKVNLLLSRMGYRSVVESSFQEGIDLNIEVRRRYSFYVEAIK